MEMRCYREILHKDLVTNEETRAKIQQAIGPHEDFLTIVKRRNCSAMDMSPVHQVSDQNHLARHREKWGRRLGRQRKRWEDSIREWTGLGFDKSHRAMQNWEKMEVTGCEIIRGAPTTLAVKG